MADEAHTGGCLRGGVRYRVAWRLQPVVDCHRAQCRRTHGHVAAYTGAARVALELVEDGGLRRRGFCGTSVF
jgi:hypothetical protein